MTDRSAEVAATLRSLADDLSPVSTRDDRAKYSARLDAVGALVLTRSRQGERYSVACADPVKTPLNELSQGALSDLYIIAVMDRSKDEQRLVRATIQKGLSQ